MYIIETRIGLEQYIFTLCENYKIKGVVQWHIEHEPSNLSLTSVKTRARRLGVRNRIVPRHSTSASKYTFGTFNLGRM